MRFVSTIGCCLALSLHGLALLAQSTQPAPENIAALEQQVQKHLQEQKPQLAIPLLRQIASLDPGNVNAQANLGVLLFFQDKYDEAMPPLRAALELQPGLWRIESLLGIAQKRTGNPGEALKHLERAFTNLDDPKIQVQAGLELIELHAAAAQFEKALSLTVRLEELAPQNPRILFAAYEIARQIMDRNLLSMMVAASDSPEMRMMMAGELGRQGDRTGAIAQYREAIRLNPALPGAHFQLAEQLRTAPDPALNAQAEEEYKAALRVNQHDALAWRQLGWILSAKGDFKAAEEDYRKALALQPNDSDAKTGLAIVLINASRTEEAMPLLESALKDDPTNMVAHFRLSGLYRRAGRTAEAEREMEAFHHYQELKDKLGKVYRQLAAPAKPE
jgi:tetratricopeptide (TPR) repeat protein